MNKTESIAAVLTLFEIATNAMATYAGANAKLIQAHGEGWTEHDERWGPAFADVDDALKKAQDRL